MKVQLTALIAALAITNPAYSQGTSHLGGKATLVRNPVIHAIIDSGRIDVVMDDPDKCGDGSLYGSFMTYNTHKPDFLVCMNNHASYAELDDTIRHEAHHAVVWCRGGRTLLSWDENLKMGTTHDLDMLYKHYEPRNYHEELEARNVARVLDNKDVADGVRNFCM